MRLFFTLLLTLSIAPLSAQLYNGNFENWINYEGHLLLQAWNIFAYDVPSVTQDFDAYEGMYAVQVEAIPYESGSYGNASTVFSIDDIPPSLDFYVKAASESGSVGVEIIFYNGEEETVDSFLWSSAEEEIADWTFVSLPIEQDLPEVTHARINIRAEVGDFSPGSAVISVDQMAFGKVSGLNDQNQDIVTLYPNPATDVVRIGQSAEVDQVEIRDIAGKLVGDYSHAAFQNGISVGHLPPACYMVIAHMKSGEIGRERLVISR